MITRDRTRIKQSASLEDSEDIIERIVHGFDRGYYDELYRDIVYAYTNKRVDAITIVDSNAKIPVYPSVRPRTRKPGRSNRILTTSYIAMSRAMSRDIEPNFPQLDMATAEIRKQAFLVRDKGQLDDEGDWRGQRASAFVEGDAFGVGWVFFGFNARPDGKFATDCQHVPCTQVIWDRHARTPKRARWVCVIHYIDPYDAAAQFKKPIAEMEQNCIRMGDGPRDTNGYHVVRVFEYMSIGIGTRKPTHAMWLHELSGEPVYKKEMPFDRIPAACMVGFLPPGVNRPVGRVQQQLSGQMMLNKIEEYLNRVLDYGWGVDIIDTTLVNGQDLKAHGNGDKLVYMRSTKSLDGKEPFKRVPAREIPRVLFDVLNYTERRYTEDSGIGDWDRGSFSATARSATEVATMDARLSMNQSYTNRQTAEFFRDFVRAGLMVMEYGDDAPMSIDVFGHNLELNDPAEPNSKVANFLNEPSQIIIASETLTADDDKLKRQADLENFFEMATLGLVGTTIDEVWFTKKVLKLMNQDEREALKQASGGPLVGLAQQPAQGEANAQPGPPGIGAPAAPREAKGRAGVVKQAARDQKQISRVA